MTSILILGWGAFFLLGIGCYTICAIKDEKIVFDSHPLILFKRFKILIPLVWGEEQTNGDNKLSFISDKSGNTWEASYIWSFVSEEIELADLLLKKISKRNIVFDESQNIIINPSEFINSQLLLNNRYEIARLEGTSTFSQDDRHYCDVVLIREKKSGACLYAENKGPILNGFLEALSFEESLVNMELLDQ